MRRWCDDRPVYTNREPSGAKARERLLPSVRTDIESGMRMLNLGVSGDTRGWRQVQNAAPAASSAAAQGMMRDAPARTRAAGVPLVVRCEPVTVVKERLPSAAAKAAALGN